MSTVLLEIIKSSTGTCVAIGDGITATRVAGPKPAVVNITVKQYTIDAKTLIEAIREHMSREK